MLSLAPSTAQIDGVWYAEYDLVEGSRCSGTTELEAAAAARDAAGRIAVEALVVAVPKLHPIQAALVPGLAKKLTAPGGLCAGCFKLALTWYARLQAGDRSLQGWLVSGVSEVPRDG